MLKCECHLWRLTPVFCLLESVLHLVKCQCNNGPQFQRQKGDVSFSDLGPLKDNERRDLNCAVKEYLIIAGYRLTAMTFFEEVTDQNLDVWQNSPACVPDALRHYYYQYLSSTTEAAEEKISMLRKNESNKCTQQSLESLNKDLKDKENLVQDLKQSLEHQRKELNDCRAEVTALKMHIEGSRSGRNMVAVDVDHEQSLSLERYKEEVKSLQMELENLKSKMATAPDFVDSTQSGKESMQIEEKVVVMDEEKSIIEHPVDAVTRVMEKETDQSLAADDNIIKAEEVSEECSVSPSNDSALTNGEGVSKQNVEPSSSNTLHLRTEDLKAETVSEKGQVPCTYSVFIH
ncbi:hypothetical protein M0R45_006669 [Rubus argutus]|uniref:LisH domain-containing protein n=1 Tax=Rubus argutus TaxID=59490 RepID=A0AAW1YR76_RUBAR